MKSIESETDNTEHHDENVSLKIRETNFKAINLIEEERKRTEVKPANLKFISRNRINTAR